MLSDYRRCIGSSLSRCCKRHTTVPSHDSYPHGAIGEDEAERLRAMRSSAEIFYLVMQSDAAGSSQTIAAALLRLTEVSHQPHKLFDHATLRRILDQASLLYRKHRVAWSHESRISAMIALGRLLESARGAIGSGNPSARKAAALHAAIATDWMASDGPHVRWEVLHQAAIGLKSRAEGAMLPSLKLLGYATAARLARLASVGAEARANPGGTTISTNISVQETASVPREAEWEADEQLAGSHSNPLVDPATGREDPWSSTKNRLAPRHLPRTGRQVAQVVEGIASGLERVLLGRRRLPAVLASGRYPGALRVPPIGIDGRSEGDADHGIPESEMRLGSGGSVASAGYSSGHADRSALVIQESADAVRALGVAIENAADLLLPQLHEQSDGHGLGALMDLRAGEVGANGEAGAARTAALLCRAACLHRELVLALQGAGADVLGMDVPPLGQEWQDVLAGQGAGAAQRGMGRLGAGDSLHLDLVARCLRVGWHDITAGRSDAEEGSLPGASGIRGSIAAGGEQIVDPVDDANARRPVYDMLVDSSVMIRSIASGETSLPSETRGLGEAALRSVLLTTHQLHPGLADHAFDMLGPGRKALSGQPSGMASHRTAAFQRGDRRRGVIDGIHQDASGMEGDVVGLKPQGRGSGNRAGPGKGRSGGSGSVDRNYGYRVPPLLSEAIESTLIGVLGTSTLADACGRMGNQHWLLVARDDSDEPHTKEDVPFGNRSATGRAAKPEESFALLPALLPDKDGGMVAEGVPRVSTASLRQVSVESWRNLQDDITALLNGSMGPFYWVGVAPSARIALATALHSSLCRQLESEPIHSQGRRSVALRAALHAVVEAAAKTAKQRTADEAIALAGSAAGLQDPPTQMLPGYARPYPKLDARQQKTILRVRDLLVAKAQQARAVLREVAEDEPYPPAALPLPAMDHMAVLTHSSRACAEVLPLEIAGTSTADRIAIALAASRLWPDGASAVAARCLEGLDLPLQASYIAGAPMAATGAAVEVEADARCRAIDFRQHRLLEAVDRAVAGAASGAQLRDIAGLSVALATAVPHLTRPNLSGEMTVSTVERNLGRLASRLARQALACARRQLQAGLSANEQQRLLLALVDVLWSTACMGALDDDLAAGVCAWLEHMAQSSDVAVMSDSFGHVSKALAELSKFHPLLSAAEFAAKKSGSSATSDLVQMHSAERGRDAGDKGDTAEDQAAGAGVYSKRRSQWVGTSRSQQYPNDDMLEAGMQELELMGCDDGDSLTTDEAIRQTCEERPSGASSLLQQHGVHGDFEDLLDEDSHANGDENVDGTVPDESQGLPDLATGGAVYGSAADSPAAPTWLQRMLPAMAKHPLQPHQWSAAQASRLLQLLVWSHALASSEHASLSGTQEEAADVSMASHEGLPSGLQAIARCFESPWAVQLRARSVTSDSKASAGTKELLRRLRSSIQYTSGARAPSQAVSDGNQTEGAQVREQRVDARVTIGIRSSEGVVLPALVRHTGTVVVAADELELAPVEGLGAGFDPGCLVAGARLQLEAWRAHGLEVVVLPRHRLRRMKNKDLFRKEVARLAELHGAARLAALLSLERGAGPNPYD